MKMKKKLLLLGAAVAVALSLVTVPALAQTEEVCVPQDAYTEVIPGTEDRYENLSWYVWTGGPRDEAPALNDPAWNDVPALPQGLPHEPVPGTVYNVSHGESGLGSWFKYDGDFIAGTPDEVIEHDAVVCDDDPDPDPDPDDDDDERDPDTEVLPKPEPDADKSNSKLASTT